MQLVKALIALLALGLCVAEAKSKKHNHNMALKEGLVAYWNMEQNPALFRVHDQSHNGNHLTGFNAPTLTTGKLGQAIEFDGVDQYLNLSSAAGISHEGGEFTVAFWVKPLALLHFGHIASTVEWGVGMRLVGSDYFLNVAVEDEEIMLSNVPLEVGRWYFVALGWYNTNGTFAWGSVNLGERMRAVQSGLTPSPGNAFNIGNAGSFPIPFVIDDFAIWRRNVSAPELRQIYDRGDGLPFEEWDAVDDCRAITCCQ